jgi:hypothetical protein
VGVPVNLKAPAISGTPLPGDLVTCSTGSWTYNPTGFRYQWNRQGQPIPGAVASAYTVQIADETDTLTCTVTASNAAGAGAPATSAGVFVGNPAKLSCPRPSGKISGLSVGPLAIGMTRTKARKTLRRTGTAGYGFDDFCLYAGFGIRAAYGSAKLLRYLKPTQRGQYANRIVIALTANPFYKLAGVAPGARVSAVARKLHLGQPFHKGINYWYFAPGGAARGILKVRDGIIYEVGLVSKPLTQTRHAQRVLLDSFEKLS